MENSSAENALTEVALALAMGIFAILILALISMGSGEAKPLPLLEITDSSSGAESTLQPGDQLLIYHRGHYYDRQLQPATPSTINPQHRLIVAVSPEMAALELLKLQQQLNHPKPQITALDHNWQQALAQKIGH